MNYIGLVTYGKGDYVSAILNMAVSTGTQPFTVGSDHDFRNLMVLNYYSRYVDGADRMSYVNRDSLLNSPPDFFLTHSFELDSQPVDQVRIGDATEYAHLESYPHSGPSGWTWHLYRQIEHSD